MSRRCFAALLFAAGCRIDSELVEKADDPVGDTADTGETGLPPVETGETGLPTPAPEIDVAPSSVTFPEVLVGDFATAVFTVTNLGDADLAVADVAWDGSGGPFTLATLDGAAPARTLAPGTSFDVVVTYTPTTTSAASALARVTSDDVDEPNVPVEIGAPGCAEGPPWTDPLLVAPAYTDGELAVVAGDGAGSFSAAFSLTTSAGETLDGPVVADVDEDGGWEIVARGASTGTLYTWAWNACDSVWAVAAGPTVGFVPAGAGDLDGDGHIDLFGATSGATDGRVALGDSAGGFTEVTGAYDLAGVYTGYALTFAYHPADLDGDGMLDLVAAAYDSAGADTAELWWFAGRGDGTFDAPMRGPDVPSAVNGLDLGDIDGDGLPDLVCGGDDDGDAGQSYVVLGDGAGLGPTASPSIDYNPSTESGTNNPGAVRARLWDWDADGDLDLTAVVETDPYSAASHEVQYLPGDGAGGFAAGGVAMSRGALRGYALAVPAGG